MTEADFAQCRSRWEEPICTSYRGYTVFETPPNSQGLTFLEMLNIAEVVRPANEAPNSAAMIHALAEA